MTSIVLIVLAVLVMIPASARIFILIAVDDWPPTVWLRIQWDKITGEDTSWSKFLTCLWCLPPWIIAVNIAAGWLSGMHPVWWVLNVWMASSLATSWVVDKVGE